MRTSAAESPSGRMSANGRSRRAKANRQRRRDFGTGHRLRQHRRGSRRYSGGSLTSKRSCTVPSARINSRTSRRPGNSTAKPFCLIGTSIAVPVARSTRTVAMTSGTAPSNRLPSIPDEAAEPWKRPRSATCSMLAQPEPCPSLRNVIRHAWPLPATMYVRPSAVWATRRATTRLAPTMLVLGLLTDSLSDRPPPSESSAVEGLRKTPYAFQRACGISLGRSPASRCTRSSETFAEF